MYSNLFYFSENIINSNKLVVYLILTIPIQINSKHIVLCMEYLAPWIVLNLNKSLAKRRIKNEWWMILMWYPQNDAFLQKNHNFCIRNIRCIFVRMWKRPFTFLFCDLIRIINLCISCCHDRIPYCNSK